VADVVWENVKLFYMLLCPCVCSEQRNCHC